MPLPSITLAEFNKIASGRQNAGQVDFKQNSAGEFTGELVKINNHVIRKSKNDVHLDGQRVVAIKEAFLGALEKASVREEDLQTIREELGLSGEIDAGADANAALLDRRYKPLTRDQIRKMLDWYANYGRGFEDGEGVATEQEVRKADRTRNMSESNQRDRDSVNREVGAAAQTGRDNSILHTIKLMTGEALDTVNEARMGEITGKNAVNEQDESKTILTNSFTALYGQMLKMLAANESDKFKMLGQDARLVKGDDGNISVLLGQGATQTKLNLKMTADDIVCRMIGQAVGGKPLLGNNVLKEMLETTYARDMDGFLAAGDRTSVSRQFASMIVMKASQAELDRNEANGVPRKPEDSVRFDDICYGNYDTECLVDVALNAIDHGDSVATKAALDDFYSHIREYNSSLSGEMKGMLAKVLDLPIQRPSEGDGMMEVNLVNNPDEILEKMDVRGAQPLADDVKPADVADVKNFVADMVYSDDMLFMELSENVNAGAKMREALAAPGRAAALAEIIKNPDVLDSAVAPTIAAVVKDGMDKFIAVLDAAFKAANNGESLDDAAKKDGFAARLAAFIADKSKISDDELARPPMIMQSMAIKGCEKLQTFINEVFNIDPKAKNAAGGLTTEPYKDKSANQIKTELEGKTLDQIRSDASQADSAAPGQIGLFKQVLSGYFTGMGRADKKTIFAAALKYADTFDFRGLDEKGHEAALTKATSKFVGAILKGTSPLMQKMMQGMPKSVMGKFSEALDDMKSKLAPIPRKIVQAHLLKMIEDTNAAETLKYRQIKGIEVMKSLGAASVGEAFLCRIKYTEQRLAPNPRDPFGDQILRDIELGAFVVVKIMRPDAEERVKREAEVFSEAAKKIGPGMSATWKGQLKQYMTEFDFTNEAKNVNTALGIYSVARNPMSPYKAIAPSVHSMQLSSIVKTTKNAMVCDLVKGDTVDRVATKARKDVDEMFGKIFVIDPKTGKPKQVEGEEGKKTLVVRDDVTFPDIAKAKTNVGKIYANLVKMQKMLIQAGKVWFSEALLASGKFHGDAHAGNLMFTNKGVKETDGITFIDFGNLYELKTAAPLLDASGNQVIGKNGQPETVNERVELLRLILGATLRNDGFVLKSVERLLSPAGKASLDKNRAKAEAAIKAINEKGNFSFHACYRLEAILSELQKLGLELPPQINCFIQSMTRMQNMFAETNALLSEIKAGFGTFKEDGKYMQGVATDPHDIIGLNLFMSGLNGDIPSEIDEADYASTLKESLAGEVDKESFVRSFWDRLASYDSANRERYEKQANTCIAFLRHGTDLDSALDSIVKRCAEETSRCLKSISDDHAKFRQSSQKHTASFAQVIMGVVFSGGEAVRNMFESNFSGTDKLLLGGSAKSISKEIGGSFWETLETTTNRLVKGAKVLGENDDKNTNVDRIELAAEEDDNQIQLNV